MGGTSGAVFISHSSTDRGAAEALAVQLQGEGARVWIAPRDVEPGRDYSEQLDAAIAQCAGLVAVVSDAATGSSAVRGEIDQAVRDGKPVFPVRLADVDAALPSLDGVKYWTDAFGPHGARNIARLGEELRAVMDRAVAPAAPRPAPVQPSAGSPPARPNTPGFAPSAPSFASMPPAPAPEARDELLSALVGPKAELYVTRWRVMNATGKNWSWNWAAFLISMFWLAYRKLWKPLGVFVAAFLAIQLLGYFIPRLGMVANAASFGLALWTGLTGTAMYKSKAEARVTRAQTIHPDPQTRLAALRMEGGVSLSAALGLLALWFALMSGLTVLKMREIGESRTGTVGVLERRTGSSLSDDGAPAWSDAMLIGAWGEVNCGGNRVEFQTGNRFVSDHVGTYALNGNVLTLKAGEQQVAITVQAIDASSMMLVVSGRPVRFVRC